MKKQKKERGIAQIFRIKLLRVTVVIFIIAVLLTTLAVSFFVRLSTTGMLQKQISVVSDEVNYYINYISKTTAEFVVDNMNQEDWDSNQFIENVSKYTKASLVRIVNEKGIIINSTDKIQIGKSLNDEKNSAEFLKLLNGKEDSHYKVLKSADDDPNHCIFYAGFTMKNRGLVQLGLSQKTYDDQLDLLVADLTKFKLVGEDGFMLIADQTGKIVSAPYNKKYTSLSEMKIQKEVTENSGNVTKVTFSGRDYFMMSNKAEHYYVIALIPREEVFATLYIGLTLVIVFVLLLLILLFARVNSISKKLIVDRIHRVNNGLTEITQGKLDTVIDVRGSVEFSKLSDDINSTVETLKSYIAREAARIDEELAFARSIQISALPNVFPQRNDFNIFASMEAAKEVGGDFYDFFFIDENHLAFLIADVSDKGIAAALFMMKAKAVVKSVAQSNSNPNEILSITNNILFENNEEHMFVTLWLGILNTKTGVVNCANGGHCSPVIKSENGDCRFLDFKANFMLGGVKNAKYISHEFTLNKGDCVFLYTDGVTEAENEQQEFYGDDRLLQAVSQCDGTAEGICTAVKANIRSFTGEAQQSDDMTMLALKYLNNM